MRYLKKYENHKDRIYHEYIDRICHKYNIKNYTINSDGSIDVNGNVNIFQTVLIELPLKFSNVSGCFDCSGNRMTSLEGCPKSVSMSFYCDNNNLTSLEGCPKSVGEHFFCSHNNIDTFEGLDFVHIDGSFYCSGNPIFNIWRLFVDHTKFEFFNDCDIIRENLVIILDRLNFFLDYINKPTVDRVWDYKCI